MESPHRYAWEHARGEPCASDVACLAAILAMLRARCGTDFRGYLARTAFRRVKNRMRAAGVEAMPEYLARLRGDPLEAPRLLEHLTIKVSRFFRNAEAVAAVRRAMEALSAERHGAPLSAWSAGCGRGEEAYTLAVLVTEVAATGGGRPRVLATDIDASALEHAAAARYSEEALEEVPADARARWLEPVDSGRLHSVRAPLRGLVDLRLHDLTRHAAPDGRAFDVVACRNVLIYLQPRLRRRVERLLRDALAPGGLLWLGEAEWPGEGAGPLEVVDRKARIFRRKGERASA